MEYSQEIINDLQQAARYWGSPETPLIGFGNGNKTSFDNTLTESLPIIHKTRTGTAFREALGIFGEGDAGVD